MRPHEPTAADSDVDDAAPVILLDEVKTARGELGADDGGVVAAVLLPVMFVIGLRLYWIPPQTEFREPLQLTWSKSFIKRLFE